MFVLFKKEVKKTVEPAPQVTTVKDIDDQIAYQYHVWNNSNDSDVIDACIHTIAGLQKMRNALNKGIATAK
jgi:hypothetical protein